MSNREEFVLKEVAVEQHQVREVLKCLLHTIIFNRALGLVRPREMHLQLLDITYVEIGDEDVEDKVNKSLMDCDSFLLRSIPRPLSSGHQSGTYSPPTVDDVERGVPFQVRLSFYEATQRQGLLKKYEERVFWETWIIHMRLMPATSGRDRRHGTDQLQKSVDDVMTHIVHNINKYKDHIPPVQDRTNSGAPGPLTYPFEVITTREANLRDSILGTVSRMFSPTSAQGPPSIIQ